jgi:Fe-S-cluster containining protein
MPQQPVSVPCGSCRACCRREIVILFPERGDDVASYEHEAIDLGGQIVSALRLKANGDCVYLDDAKGCTIHDRAPAVCKAFDCRQYFLGMTRADRRVTERQAKNKSQIFAAARERLFTLTAEQRAAALRRRVQGAGVYLGDEKIIA